MNKLLSTTTLLLLCLTFFNHTVSPQNKEDVSEEIAKIQSDLEELRGAAFKYPVKHALQSQEAFGAYLEKAIDRQIPDDLLENYGKVVAKLGLYRGPKIEDFKALVKRVMQSQAAAYYDPKQKTFFLVMQGLNDSMLDAIYAHELYHGFQDQYFDLERFILSSDSRQLNDDQLLARQAVVEGEATLIMTLWTMKNLLGQVPPASALRMAVQMQAQMDVQQMLQMVNQASVSQGQPDDMKNAVASMKEIPGFLLESLIGAYLKGMAFVFEIQQLGWDKVAELYENPPVSSEQILHPQKWVDNEKPIRFIWPELDNPIFANWTLLETNTLGELQWRIVFSEHGLGSIAATAAEGWHGDSFAVFEDDSNGRLLLMLISSWDSEDEAAEFERAYDRLLQVKYAEAEENVSVIRQANEVIIVEGGDIDLHDDFIQYLEQVVRSPD